METGEGDTRLKIVLLGPSNSGKSSLLSRYTKGQFKPRYDVTLGLDFSSKTIQIGAQVVTLIFWDVGGAESYRRLIKPYLQNADCCVLVYDVNSIQPFEELEVCKQEIERLVGVNQGLEPLPWVVVGSKVDQGETVG